MLKNILTFLKLHLSRGKETAIFNEVLMALSVAEVSSSQCCGTAEVLKRWC